jgi:HEAT repeat protein
MSEEAVPANLVPKTRTFSVRAKSLFILVAVFWAGPARAQDDTTFNGKTVDGWIAALRDKSNPQRGRAASALACFGPAANGAVPDLIEMAKDERFEFYANAIEAMGRIGPDAGPAVPILIAKLSKQQCILEMQGSFGSSLHGNVELALARIGAPALPALVKMLEPPYELTDTCVVKILGDMGPTAKGAVPALIRALAHDGSNTPPRELRRHAIMALGKIGPDANSAIPSLNALLFENDDEFGEYPGEIVGALDKLGAAPVLKILSLFLRTGDFVAPALLAELGPRAKEAAPMLRHALADKRPFIAINAAIILTLVDPPAADAIPVLVEALEHPDQNVELSVPLALGRLGPDARSAIPALIRLAEKRHAQSDETDFIVALSRIDPEGRVCVPALVAALKGEDPDVSRTAADCLYLLGPRARDSIADLVAVTRRHFDVNLPDSNPAVSAVRALGRVGPASKLVIPALVDALENDDYTVAAAAADALGSLGAEAQAVVPALIKALDFNKDRISSYSDFYVRAAAAFALGRIGPESRAAIPALKKMMEDKHSEVSSAGAVALLLVDPNGKELVEKYVTQFPSAQSRALVLGAMGKTCLEADVRTRDQLEILNFNLSGSESGNRFGDYRQPVIEDWIELIGRSGAGARLAIPRLKELSKDRNPWIRQSAADALARIVSIPTNK